MSNNFIKHFMRRAQKFIHKHPNVIAIAIIFVSLTLVFIRWVGSGLYANGDTPIINQHNINQVFSLYVWRGYHDLGGFIAEIPLLLIGYISSLPNRLLGLSYNGFSIRFFYIFPYLAISSISMYFLMKKISHSSLAGLFSSLLYTINTPIISAISQGHILHIFPQAITPLILLLTINYLEDTKKKYFIPIISALFVLISLYEVRFMLMIYAIFVLFCFYYILAKRDLLKSIIMLVVGASVPVIVFNLYWLIPIITTVNSAQTYPIFNRPIFGTEFFHIVHPLTNHHPYWSVDNFRVFSSQSVPIIFFSIPLIVVLALKRHADKGILIFFSLIYILGVFLVKGLNPPFGDIYNYMFHNIPGFKIFRETAKFYHLITLSSAVIMGIFLSGLNKTRHIVIVTILFTSMLMMMSLSLMSGNIGALTYPNKTDDRDYYQANNYLKKDGRNNYFRVLWIPKTSGLSNFSTSIPNVNLSTMAEVWYSLMDLKITAKDNMYSKILLANELNNILDLQSIKYIVLTKEKTYADGDQYYWYGNRNEYKEILDKLSFLEKVKTKSNNISIYLNKDYYPHFYITKNQQKHEINQDFKGVKNVLVSPSKYEVVIDGLKEPHYLNFSEKYHSGWELYINEELRGKTIDAKQIPIPKSYHKETEAGLNSFYLDPTYICRMYTCLSKTGQGKKLHMALVFEPQLQYNRSLIFIPISIVILIIFSAYAIYEHRRKI